MYWIKVSDRFPKLGVDILITNGESVRIYCISNLEIKWRDSLTIRSYVRDNNGRLEGFNFTVTHWMELPAPPEKDQAIWNLEFGESQIESLGLHNKEAKQDGLE